MYKDFFFLNQITLVRLREDTMGREIIKGSDVTWARKKDSVSEVHPSAITDHVAKNNHNID